MAVFLTNVKEMFAKAREILPGMSKDFYLLTDYMANNTNDRLVPFGIIMHTINVLDDLEKCRNGYGLDFPKELADRRNFVRLQINLIPQLIDEVADKEFADEVRKLWNDVFDEVPPRRVDVTAVDTDTEYPEYVKIAADWWADAIVSSRVSGDADLPFILYALKAGSTKEYSPEQIKLFKDAVAKGIMAELSINDQCILKVEYQPCTILSEAGKLIDLSELNFPWKTNMVISRDEVYVIEGYSPKKVLWER